MSELIPAATILLLRDAPAFEVLMVERHADVPFAGGAIVFPGGRIDKGDYAAEWKDHSDGLDGVPAEQIPARIAAIREAFEETGILLARRDAGGAFVSDDIARALNDWRAIVEKDDSQFLAMIAQENLRLACDALHLFAHWAPPARVKHRRYDTMFFAAKTPPGQEAREDGNEATEAVWFAPGEALALQEKGERKMIFPTSRNVELLNVTDSAEKTIAYAYERKIEPVSPAIAEIDGENYMTIPDDLGYPVTKEPLEQVMRSF